MTDTTTTTPQRRNLWRDVDLRAVAPFIALALLLVLGSFAHDNFLTANNLLNVMTRSAYIAIIAIGATFVITAGGLDLSVGAMTAFIASLAIMFMNSDGIANPLTMVLAATALMLAIGMACGLTNGLVITLGKIEPFIATLGMMGIYRGLTTWLSQGGAITLRNPDVQAIYRPVYFGNLFGIPYPVLAIFVTAAIAAFILYRTSFGRHVIAVGSNEDVARYSGISVARVRTMTYLIQGLCVAGACLIYIPRLSSTTATTGTMWELNAITAVVVGGTALRGGVGRVWGTVAGAFILEIIGNIMLLTTYVSEYLLGAIQGAIVIVAMLVQRSLTRKS
ncbi:ABC transporter permease [Aminobacter carboxidus]|uniref:ABC transporter permease n=1 Tax=Aminobacter carboxidus TaxID=376165 RepID=A0ABR9GIC8_9HYPH|nr:ABC transporter permease [Aminobacter carboxidus]MBE1203417.1 ABC transporter permease [Aminobacter carboxidus]